MKGIQFLIDEEGEKTAVVIDLKKHAELWEDFYDRALARGLCQHSQEHPELHTSCRFSPALSGRP